MKHSLMKIKKKGLSRIIFILAILLFAWQSFAQTEKDEGESFIVKGKSAASDHVYSKSYLLDGKLNKTVPANLLPTGSVQDLQNMKRPSLGLPVGWEPRSGITKYNTTTIGAYQVKGLFRYTNTDLSVDDFYAQVNDQLYRASVMPPTTTTTFGTSVYTLDTGSSPAFGEKVGDDLIFAASGTTPFATSGATAYPDGVYVMHVSGNTTYDNGYDRVRDNRQDTNLTLVQSNAASEALYIGYRRRLSGVIFDFVSGATNSVSSGVSVFAQRSGSQTEVSAIVDGTATGTTTFYQSGSITWTASTLDEPYVLPSTKDHLFWYKFTVTADITDGVKAYRIRVIPQTEAMTNLWSGYYDTAVGVLLSSATGYTNYTGETTDGLSATYVDLATLATTNALYVGFVNKSFGVYLELVAGKENNGTALGLAISYANAVTDSWTAISGTTIDGTAAGDYALNHSGLVQWDGTSINESKRILGGILTPLYWYKLSWSATLPTTNGPQIAEIGESEKPETIPAMPQYDFMIEHAQRALYGPSIKNRHGLDFSHPNAPHVLNGPMTGSTGNIFGPGIPNAATRLYSYVIISTKDPYRTYVLEGKVPGKWDELLLSDRVGAVAPHTLITVQDAVRIFSQDRSVHASIFLSHDGIYMTDGQTVMCISNPIANYWDTGTTPYIEPAYAYLSYAWVDYSEKTVHFAVPVRLGTSAQTTLNREIVYSYLSDEWYDIYTRANPLSCGLSLVGSDGQRLTYGGDYAGYVHRLNTGTNDNGTAINYFLKTADISPLAGVQSDFFNYSSQLRAVKLKGEAGTGTADLTVFADGSITGTAPTVSTLTMVHSGFKYFQGRFNMQDSIRGETFALKLRGGNTDEATGSFLGFSLDFWPIRDTQ